jgi:hypothetical protein
MKKQDPIISLNKQRNARYLKRNEKFIIKIPKTDDEALRIDKEN